MKAVRYWPYASWVTKKKIQAKKLLLVRPKKKNKNGKKGTREREKERLLQRFLRYSQTKKKKKKGRKKERKKKSTIFNIVSLSGILTITKFVLLRKFKQT